MRMQLQVAQLLKLHLTLASRTLLFRGTFLLCALDNRKKNAQSSILSYCQGVVKTSSDVTKSLEFGEPSDTLRSQEMLSQN